VKRLIVEAADAKKVGDRTIRLLNQKGSLALAGASGAAAGRSKPSAAH
jgi:hypothetical protein